MRKNQANVLNWSTNEKSNRRPPPAITDAKQTKAIDEEHK